jgi:hypothetical protein
MADLDEKWSKRPLSEWTFADLNARFNALYQEELVLSREREKIRLELATRRQRILDNRSEP